MSNVDDIEILDLNDDLINHEVVRKNLPVIVPVRENNKKMESHSNQYVYVMILFAITVIVLTVMFASLV